MKKILFPLILIFILISCAGNQDVLDTHTEDNISIDELQAENIIEEEKEIEIDVSEEGKLYIEEGKLFFDNGSNKEHITKNVEYIGNKCKNSGTRKTNNVESILGSNNQYAVVLIQGGMCEGGGWEFVYIINRETFEYVESVTSYLIREYGDTTLYQYLGVTDDKFIINVFNYNAEPTLGFSRTIIDPNQKIVDIIEVDKNREFIEKKEIPFEELFMEYPDTIIGNGFIQKEYASSKYIYYDDKEIRALGINHSIDSYEINENFYGISIGDNGFSYYQILFHLDTKQIYELDGGKIQDIQEGTLGIYVHQSYPTNGIILIRKDGTQKRLFRIETTNQVESSIIDFELLINKQIKINYLDGGDGLEKQEIVDLN